MKVLQVITSLHTGGAEKLMVDIIPRLNKRGIQCELLTFDGTITPFRKKLENEGVKVYDFGEGNKIYSLKNLIKLLPFLKRYDIVHTHNTASQIFAALGSVLCPVVLVTTEHNTSNRRRNWPFYAPLDRWMYSRYKTIINISDKTQECLQNYLPAITSKLTTIYNGIPLEEYRNALPNEEISITYKNIRKIFMVAGFRYQKDQRTVIRALKYLDDSCHLFLVGDGVKREECEELTRSLGLSDRVHFLGNRCDVPSLLKTADICVISSHWEGFGLAAVEGMAAGKPVIASDIPGVAEVVRGAGILFKQGNSEDLAKKIKILFKDKSIREQVITSCEKRAEEYSIEKMTDRYLTLYKTIND